MRIAMLAPRLSVQGPLPKHTPLLVQGLRDLGCEIELLPWGRRREGEGLSAKVLGRVHDMLSARKAIISGGFPVVVVKTAHDWNTLVRDIGISRILPRDRTVVFQFHGSQSPRLVAPGSRLFKLATRVLLARADGLLVLSRAEQAEWLAFCPQKSVRVVRNVRPASFRVATHPTVPGDETPEVLCVSRLLPGKGVLELVRALPLVLREMPCRLVLVGDGVEATRLRALSDKLGVREWVELTGYLDGDALAARYESAAIFALPTSLPEGFPTVLLEAMAGGLPIVTTESRGPADHLSDGVNAIFVPPNDSGSIASAILTLLNDPALSTSMGLANREKAREFDQEPVAREYLGALEEITSGASFPVRLPARAQK